MDERWWHLAACNDEAVDAEWFHPEPGQSDDLALEVCSRCPVAADCREAAVEEEAGRGSYIFGVRGGMSAKDRGPLVWALRRQVRQQESTVTKRIVDMADKGVALRDIARAMGMKPDAVAVRLKRAKGRDLQALAPTAAGGDS